MSEKHQPLLVDLPPGLGHLGKIKLIAIPFQIYPHEVVPIRAVGLMQKAVDLVDPHAELPFLKLLSGYQSKG